MAEGTQALHTQVPQSLEKGNQSGGGGQRWERAVAEFLLPPCFLGNQRSRSVEADPKMEFGVQNTGGGVDSTVF